jgi:hypothetical protein
MHHQPRNEPEIAAAVCGGVDKLMSKGVGPRGALRRTARKYGMNPRYVRALIAQGERSTGWEA